MPNSNQNSAPNNGTSEELDLAIPDMSTEADEMQVKAILEKLPGIRAVRLIERGAWIEYNSVGITHEEIRTAIRQAGFRASTFQDSKTGKTGSSSQ
ncbi:MAG TPA: hypothetical protein VF593_03530 [Chthoniobacteraceae bacterium]|jgi:copper chaperone CopZ